MKPPTFWRQPNLWGALLSPLGWIYGAITVARLKAITPIKVSVPVICVGNLSLGGTGKTPTVMALIQILRNLGHTPHVLTRGYGGILTGNKQVDVYLHTAEDVGDEPLLLARHAPTWVGKDRVVSAYRAIEAGATILIMDDGLQNPYLHKDIKIAVFDGLSPIGNSHIFPAGPLRQSLASGLDLIDAALLINFTATPTWLGHKLSFKGALETDQRPNPIQKYLAFAGIGEPQKFFNTLVAYGYAIQRAISFPDHHPYTSQDMDALLNEAAREGLQLITTEKDAIKWPSSFQNSLQVLKVTLVMENIDGFQKWLRKMGCCNSR